MKEITGPERVFVTILLLFAAGLRITGAANGQPDPQYAPSLSPNQMIHYQTPVHPDEFHQIVKPLRMLVKGQLNPEFLENPSFLINLNFITFWITGADKGINPDLWGTNERTYAPFHLYVIGRIYSALGGLMAVSGIYAVTRMVAGRFAAANAGLLTAVSFPMVQHAHYATTSSLAAGFAVLSVWASFACLKSQRLRWWLFALAGIAAGFAAGSRYNAAGVSLVVFCSGLVLLYRQWSRRTFWVVLIGWAAFPLAFVISTPYAILDFDRFVHDFRYISSQYVSDGATLAVTFHGLLYEYAYLGVYALGLPASLAAVSGLYLALKSRPKDWLRRNSRFLFVAILLVYLIAYSLAVLRTVRPNLAEQMLLPVMPFFALLAGSSLAWLYDRFHRHGNWLAPILVLAVVMMPMAFSVQFVALLKHPDTRYVMQQWIYDHIPRGSYIQLNGPYNVPLDEADYRTTQTFGDSALSPDDLRAAGVDYVLRSDAITFNERHSPDLEPGGYVEALTAYDKLLNRSLVEVAHIDRPVWFGYDWFMNSAAFWHDPGLTLYCMSDESCVNVR